MTNAIADYVDFMGVGISKKDHVKSVVKNNLNNPRARAFGRSINGALVGNRHALKRGYKLYSFDGEILSSGTTSVSKNEYSPDF